MAAVAGPWSSEFSSSYSVMSGGLGFGRPMRSTNTPSTTRGGRVSSSSLINVLVSPACRARIPGDSSFSPLLELVSKDRDVEAAKSQLLLQEEIPCA